MAQGHNNTQHSEMIDFNGMLTSIELFYTKKLGNVYIMFILTFFF